MGPPTFWHPIAGLTIHRGAGSSIRSTTSCSTERARTRSSRSRSARSIISAICRRTCSAISGPHSLSFVSSFSSKASPRGLRSELESRRKARRRGARVEQGPDDEPFGGRLAGFEQTIRCFGGERFSHVLIRYLSPSKLCVLGVGTRSHCAFHLTGYQHRLGCGRGSRPRKQRRSPLRSVSGVGSLSA